MWLTTSALSMSLSMVMIMKRGRKKDGRRRPKDKASKQAGNSANIYYGSKIAFASQGIWLRLFASVLLKAKTAELIWQGCTKCHSIYRALRDRGLLLPTDCQHVENNLWAKVGLEIQLGCYHIKHGPNQWKATCTMCRKRWRTLIIGCTGNFGNE